MYPATTQTSVSSRMVVCHVAVGDLWAGAEVQLKVLLSQLVARPEFKLSVVLFNAGRLEKEIKGLGIPVRVLPEARWGGLRILSELIREFRRSGVQLVHTHKYKDTILAAPAAKLCGIPHVVRTVHGLSEPFHGWQALKMNLYESIERSVHRHCVDAIIGVSSQIEAKYRTEGHRSLVTCIRNGIEIDAEPIQIDRARLRQDLGIDPETCLIGTIGRLTPVKGIPYLLQAASLLYRQGVRVKVLLVGDGAIRAELHAQARDLGIGENVVFLGHREDTRELMKAVDIFALPSLSEGIPMALLEAMAASCAIVASRVGGVPEVIEDGVEGILVEPKAANAIAEGCRRLLRAPDAAKRMGELARKRVERDFSAEGMAQGVASIYRNLASPRGRS